MIGIVLVGHTHIASEMLEAAEHVLGPQALITAIDTGPEQNPRALAEALDQAFHRCDVGDGILLLTDMFGGTPCNIALSTAARHAHVEVVSGFNLPLLIKALSLRSQTGDLNRLARQVVTSGRQYICQPSTLSAKPEQTDHA